MQMKRKSIISSSGAHLRPTAALCGAAILSLCTALSCAKIEVTPVEDTKKGQIHYDLVPVKTETKATVSAFPTTSTFGSTAWFLPEGKSWSGNSAEALSTSLKRRFPTKRESGRRGKAAKSILGQ